VGGFEFYICMSVFDCLLNTMMRVIYPFWMRSRKVRYVVVIGELGGGRARCRQGV